MKPLMSHVLRDHVLLGALAAALLYPSWGLWPTLLFWLANVLIDVDHYFHFLLCVRLKAFSFSSMFRFHEEVFKRRDQVKFLALEIFHTLEFLALVGIVGFWFLPGLQPVFWGMIFHNLVDFVHLRRYGILTYRAHSFVEYWLRRRKIRASGLTPISPFGRA